MNHLSGYIGNPFHQGAVPEFSVDDYFRHKQLQMAENPEDSEEGPYANYLKELDFNDSVLRSQTFSVQADREYQQQLFVLKEMQMAENEKHLFEVK